MLDSWPLIQGSWCSYNLMAVLCSQDQYFFEAPGALRQSIFKISLRYLRLVQNSTQNDWDGNKNDL